MGNSVFGRALLAAALIALPVIAVAATFFAVVPQFPVNASSNPIVIQSTAGQGFPASRAALLASTDVNSAALFKLAVRAIPDSRPLRAGEYEIPTGATLADLLTILRTAPPYQHRITVVEGWSRAALLQAVGQHPAVVPETSAVRSLDGYHYLPETYFFERGVSAEALLGRMKTAFETEVATVWESRDRGLALKSPEDLVILASIIEKETGQAGERGLVSAVFHNRLKAGIRLQSDPTVVYAVAGDGGLNRPLSKADLALSHPYNTYRSKGLPPGPICLVGREALFAAAHPALVPYLYFVADGKGGHRFSSDLADHNQNVALYRRYQRLQSGKD